METTNHAPSGHVGSGASFGVPGAGTRVVGQHLFGAQYNGKIRQRRPSTTDHEAVMFEVEFDAPTEIDKDDIRTAIVVTAFPPKFPGDRKWQDGYGGWFRVAETWADWSRPALTAEICARMAHFYGQTDGAMKFPNSAEGDILKMVYALLSPNIPHEPHGK